MHDLTLPGTIPGLLRRTSPVMAWEEFTAQGQSVVVSLFFGGMTALIATPDGLHEERLAALSLDLTDATGRAHAAWWLAERAGGDGSQLIDGTFDNGQRDIDMPDYLWGACCTDLYPHDPRLLPDGSRWVDAEALRRVVLHVAEVAS